MGLFSKKAYVCERCGKEFDARIESHYCAECQKILDDKRNYVYSYLKYMDRLFDYDEDLLDELISHKNAILEKYKIEGGITKDLIAYAGDNYKKLSEDELNTVLNGICNALALEWAPDVITRNIFFSGTYPDAVIDLNDVFAVGYTTGYTTNHVSSSNYETWLCVLFSNDPYIKAIPCVCSNKLGMFEMKSKKGRKNVESTFGCICKNLQYPVEDLKKLKKEIKSENEVKGNIGVKEMLDLIDDAIDQRGVFKAKKLEKNEDIDFAHSRAAAQSEGYILFSDVQKLLKTDKMFNRKFWNPYLALVILNMATGVLEQSDGDLELE